MRRAEPASSVAGEIFVEEDEILEMRVSAVARIVAVARPPPLRVGQEGGGETLLDPDCRFLKGHEDSRARGALDAKGVAIEVVITAQRFVTW